MAVKMSPTVDPSRTSSRSAGRQGSGDGSSSPPIGPRIGIEGEKAFKDSLSAVVSNVKALGAEMKAVTAAFSGNEPAGDLVEHPPDGQVLHLEPGQSGPGAVVVEPRGASRSRAAFWGSGTRCASPWRRARH